MSVWQILICITFNLILAISIYTDYKYHKIYNSVTYSGIILGFILNTMQYGTEGFFSCCFSFIVSFAFFLLFYFFKMLGAGDVKLIVAIAVLMNVFYTIAGLVIGSFFAGMYGVFVLAKTKNKKATIPYGIFIGIGFYVYQVLVYFTAV